MKVGMMQPTFMPWLGFFELIYRSDVFVLGDDSQFSVGSFHQRNRLFVQAGQVAWYTVPVQKKEAFGKALNQAPIAEERNWRQKMWRQIAMNYHKTPYYTHIAPPVEQWLLAATDSLAAQNVAFIMLACDLMGLQREFRLASALPDRRARSHRVLDLLRWCEADRYYCAQGSFAYMKQEGVFPVEGIETLFQAYAPRPYPQLGAQGEFVPCLSVLDALFNVGPEETLKLIACGTAKWTTWEEMLALDTAGQAGHQGDAHHEPSAP